MMPSKKSSEKSSKSRSRSRSRGRSQRSSSRTRRSSRSRASESSTESPKPAVAKKSSSRSSRKSSSLESRDGEVRETKSVNAVSARVESEKKVESNEAKTLTSHTEIRRSETTQKVTVSESSEAAPARMSMRLREKRGEVEHCDLKAIPMESKSAKTKKYVLAGPWFPVILVFSIPLLSVYLSIMCSKRTCFPRLVNFPLRLASYLDLKIFLICIGWIAFQALLCLIPLGRVCKGLVHKNGTRLNYRCNGLIGLVISLGLITGLVVARSRWPTHVPSVTFVLDHFLALQTSAIIVAFLTGIVMYITARLYARERDLNPFGNSGNCLYDAAVGHEMHPRLFRGLDMKFFTLSRLSMISTAALVLLFTIKDFENRGTDKGLTNVPLIAVAVQQFIYVTDSLFFEDALLTSFAMQREGFGLIHCFTRMVWMPFITTMPVRYLSYLSTKDLPQWSSYAYAGIVMLHLAAFVVRRGAISQKSDYRREPNHPAFSSLDTIHSSSHKRLLAGGWWGLVRHPNYLGELLVYIAWTLPVGLKMSTPWLCPLFLLLTFVVRMRMVENYCAQRHGSGWKSYCEKVRSRLVPFLL